jgi:nitrile hydratase accessory protein
MTSFPPASVPRRNGELAFEAPWESRAFGLAAAYLAASRRSWDAFRPHLIAAIADLADSTPYYEAWVAALDRLLAADGLPASGIAEGPAILPATDVTPQLAAHETTSAGLR